jgi:hypothetical protein
VAESNGQQGGRKILFEMKILVFCALNLLNYSAKQNLFQLTPWPHSNNVDTALQWHLQHLHKHGMRTFFAHSLPKQRVTS